MDDGVVRVSHVDRHAVIIGVIARHPPERLSKLDYVLHNKRRVLSVPRKGGRWKKMSAINKKLSGNVPSGVGSPFVNIGPGGVR